MILSELFPWFPLAGKAGDTIVILLALGILVTLAIVILGKRTKK